MTWMLDSEPAEEALEDAGVAEHGASLRSTSGRVLQTLSIIWLVVVAWWTGYFIEDLIDARSAIVAIEQRLGERLPEPPLVPEGIFQELRGIFCCHGFRADSVDSTFADAVVLFFGAIATYSVGLPLLRSNIARWSTSRAARWISAAMMMIIIVHVALTIGFWDTIDHVTYVVSW